MSNVQTKLDGLEEQREKLDDDIFHQEKVLNRMENQLRAIISDIRRMRDSLNKKKRTAAELTCSIEFLQNEVDKIKAAAQSFEVLKVLALEDGDKQLAEEYYRKQIELSNKL